MNNDREQSEFYLWVLFCQLRQRQFALGPDDFEALRVALRLGFGLETRDELCTLCCTLWAKSRYERDAVIALFEQRVPRDMALLKRDDVLPNQEALPLDTSLPSLPHQSPPVVARSQGLPALPFSGVNVAKRPLVFLPQFPLSYREIAQAWRRLRQPVREGPATELDADATIARRSRSGMVVAPVLVPRRRNTARLLLLVDQQGSMTPFHHFIEHTCNAIIDAGRLKRVARFYFHDTPAEGSDDAVLELLDNRPAPSLDPVMAQIQPFDDGLVFADAQLLQPKHLSTVLDDYAQGANVVILSDAGAARGHYDVHRLLDTIAFLKALRKRTSRFVWLNPLPKGYWHNSTAAAIARHIPMFPLERVGLYQAVNVLRGQPYRVEKPV